jgi:hypothetical protein
MNLKTTIALLILGAGCAALFWKGPSLAPMLGLGPEPVAVSKEGAEPAILSAPVDQISRVEIEVPGQRPLVLKSPAAGQPLELPGDWPIRRYEVDELLATLRDLKSRYFPIPVDDKTDLSQYGLASDQKPVTVKITSKDGTQVLRFGEEPAKAGVTPFTRATFVRADGKNEIVRLGPNVLPVLRRNEELYRRRQLFPEAIRARVAQKQPPRFPGMDEPPPSSPTTFLLSNAATSIALDTPSGRIALQRVAPLPQPEVVTVEKPEEPKFPFPKKKEATPEQESEPAIQPAKLAQSWLLSAPIRDRAEPDKLRAILTGIPSLWVEKFVDSPQGPDYFYGLGSTPALVPQIFTLLGGSIPAGIGENPLRNILNLAALPEAKSPVARITVGFGEKPNEKTRTLQIGRVSRTSGSDEFRFAKLEDNPLVFELRTDKLNDLQISFAKPSFGPSNSVDELRDPNVVRFDDKGVTGIEIISHAGKDERRILMEKVGDEWKLMQPFQEAADKAEITELLKLLKDMEARSGSIIDPGASDTARLAVMGGMAHLDPIRFLGLEPDKVKKITLTFDPKANRPPATILVGRRDSTSGKRAVMVEGWTRISVVDDRGDADKVSRFDRQPSAYRTLKLFDPLKSKINEVVVQRGAIAGRAADTFTIRQVEPKEGELTLGGEWTITAPFKAAADRIAASQLVGQLNALDNLKYVYDPKTDDHLVSADQWPRFLLGLGALASAFDPTGEAFFGLDKPLLTITLKFSEPKGAADVVIEVGRARTPTEHYARLKGTTALFTVSDQLVKNADHKPEELVDRTLIQFAGKPEVQAIRRSMNGQELEISQNNSALWDIVKPMVAKADQTMIEDLANELTHLRAARIEAVSPSDLKKYGLDPPTAVLSIEALEKNKLVERVVQIGAPVDPMKPDGERFVKAQGSTMVAVMAAPLASKLVAAPQKFRDLTLGPGFVTADKIVIERGDRKATFVKGAGGWRMKEPIDAEAEDEALRDVHDMLARLRAEEFVEDKPKDLAKYGLDKPAHWRVYYGDKEVLHLLVGNREKIGPPDKQTEGYRVYAKLDKGDAVVLLDMPLTTRLSAEFRRRIIWEGVDDKDVTEIAIKATDTKDSFTLVKGKAPAGWSDPAKPDDKLDAELVNNLVFTVGNLKVDRYIVDRGVTDLKPYGLDKARTLTITTLDGKKHSLLLGGLFEGKKLYAKLDDPARSDVFLLSENYTRVLNRPRSEYSVKKEEPKKEEPKKEEPKKENKKEPDPKKESKKDEPKKEPEKK